MSTNNVIPNKAAYRYADMWADELRSQLKAAGKDASGRLIKSIRPEVVGSLGEMNIDITAEDYLKYVDEGRPSKFERPGIKRVPISALQQWIAIKNIQPRAGMTVEALPWVIQNSIWRKGIDPTNVIPKTKEAMLKNTRAITLLEVAIATNLENNIISPDNKIITEN